MKTLTYTIFCQILVLTILISLKDTPKTIIYLTSKAKQNVFLIQQYNIWEIQSTIIFQRIATFR